MRLKLIACEILYREICATVARSSHVVDIEFLPKGLHDIGSAPMRERLQQAVDRVDAASYDAVILGYALCGNGLVGLTARALPLVVTRGHDCITLFLGGKERYLEYFDSHPGVYFKTTGWIERGETAGELTQLSRRKNGLGYSFEELVAKYGEDNARYLYEQLGDRTRNYRQFTFIEMGVEPDSSFEEHARREARERGWEFEKVRGDLSLIERLVNGQWNPADFLVVRPGQSIVARHDGSIVGVEEEAA